jgi:hypothetical protein
MTLFRRHAGATKDAEMRDVAKAHRILDRLKAGHNETPTQVNWALRMTGDLTETTERIDDDFQRNDG